MSFHICDLISHVLLLMGSAPFVSFFFIMRKGVFCLNATGRNMIDS